MPSQRDQARSVVGHGWSRFRAASFGFQGPGDRVAAGPDRALGDAIIIKSYGNLRLATCGLGLGLAARVAAPCPMIGNVEFSSI